MCSKLLVCVTGSVAAIKLEDLIKSLRGKEPAMEIRVVVTKNAKFFIDRSNIDIECPVYDDASEWDSWNTKGDPVVHIDLRKWCDIMVICPLSANTLAKMANGLCDNLVTSIIRAWDRSKRLIVCPAMNTYMWENTITKKQLETICELYGCEIVEPKDNYPLACGDIGPGALASIQDIVDRILSP